jgi:hypothetical protein
MVFSVWSAPSLCRKDEQEKLVSWRLELAVGIHEFQVSSGSSWLAVRNLYC